MGERVTLQNEFKLLKQPTFFLWFLKCTPAFLLPQHVIVGRQKLPTSKVVEPVSRPWGLSGGWWEGQWVWIVWMEVHLQGAKLYASSLLGFDWFDETWEKHALPFKKVGKLVTRGSKLSTRISHVSCSPLFPVFSSGDRHHLFRKLPRPSVQPPNFWRGSGWSSSYSSSLPTCFFCGLSMNPWLNQKGLPPSLPPLPWPSLWDRTSKLPSFLEAQKNN